MMSTGHIHMMAIFFWYYGWEVQMLVESYAAVHQVATQYKCNMDKIRPYFKVQLHNW